MGAKGLGWGNRFFPEIRINFCSSRQLELSPRCQSAVLSTIIAGVALIAYLGVSRIGYERLLDQSETAAARARAASAEREQQVLRLYQKLAGQQQDRDQARREAAALTEQTLALRNALSSAQAKLHSFGEMEDQLAALDSDIESLTIPMSTPTQKRPAVTVITQFDAETRQALDQERARNAELTAKLENMQAERAAEVSQLAQYKTSLEKTAQDLARLGAMGTKRTTKHGRIRQQLDQICRRLSQIRLPVPDAEAAAASTISSAAQAAATPLRALSARIANLDVARLKAVEDALRSAGVNLRQVASRMSLAHSEGGPFMPPPKADGIGADAVSPEKLAAIKALTKALPISAPLADYELGSGFGSRSDPFNRRPAFHTGIDMDARYSSPVYATAAGTVIYAGWLGDYGRVVEIDHGFGIVTLYGHLRRCLVSVGEAVSPQTRIGLLGSTGRSTGPHVHYEVRVDGHPEDPQKFLGLARLLPLAAIR